MPSHSIQRSLRLLHLELDAPSDWNCRKRVLDIDRANVGQSMLRLGTRNHSPYRTGETMYIHM